MNFAAPPRLTDAELSDHVTRMRAGDGRAREGLFLSLMPLVMRAVRRNRFAGRVDPEDATQEGMLGLWRALPYYRETTADGRRCPPVPASASAWAEQHVKAFVGKEVRRSVRFPTPRADPEDGSTLLERLPAEPDPPSEDSSLSAAVHAALGKLSRRHAEVIRLRFGIGGGPQLTQSEVGRLLGTSRQNVYRVEKLALRRLAASLAGLVKGGAV